MDYYWQPEAYCVMKYRDTAGNEELIWNSRNGVTPFGIRSRQGFDAVHVDFHEDRYDPYHLVQLGERVFVTMTMEHARQIARKRVEQDWADPDQNMREHPFLGPLGEEGAAEHLAQAYYGEGQNPKLIEIADEETLQRLRAGIREQQELNEAQRPVTLEHRRRLLASRHRW